MEVVMVLAINKTKTAMVVNMRTARFWQLRFDHKKQYQVCQKMRDHPGMYFGQLYDYYYFLQQTIINLLSI